MDHNKAHGIVPQTIKKSVARGLIEVFGYSGDGSDNSGYKKVRAAVEKYHDDPKGLGKEIDKLRKKMKKAAEKLEFEEAAQIRDEIKRLEMLQLAALSGDVEKVSHVVLEKGEGE